MKKVKIQNNRGHIARLSEKRNVPSKGNVILDESEWKEIYGESRIIRRAVQDNILSVLAVPEEAPKASTKKKKVVEDTKPSAK